MKTMLVLSMGALLLAGTLSAQTPVPEWQAGVDKVKNLIQSNPAQASEEAGELLKGKNKKNVDLVTSVAHVYLDAGKITEAQEYLAMAKKANNKDPKVSVLEGDIALAQKNIGQACQLYEQANNAKADLFISIHTNSVAGGKTVKGASTWTLGLAKSDANLEVAKRENSVILYESDYKTRYAGFNPNSAESYIIFEFMQDKYMSQSVHLASLVQKEFRHTCKRADRGVHQAGFLVLKASAMPSILVELGFISNPEEERYLNSEAGTTTLANGIFRAFLSYKREHEIRMTGSSRTLLPEDTDAGRVEEEIPASPVSNNTETKQNTEKVADRQTDSAAPVFKIQILTSSRPLAANDKRLKELKGVEYYQEGGLCKYTYGASTDYNKVLRTKREIAPKFKDAFIIAFKNGKKTSVSAAIEEFKKKRNK